MHIDEVLSNLIFIILSLFEFILDFIGSIQSMRSFFSYWLVIWMKWLQIGFMSPVQKWLFACW